MGYTSMSVRMMKKKMDVGEEQQLKRSQLPSPSDARSSSLATTFVR